MVIRVQPGILKWMPIEEIKGCPNIKTSFVTIQRRWREARENTPDGEPIPRQYYCVFCGRPQKSIHGLRRHMGHCQKRKFYRKCMKDGIDFTVGSKIFNIRTKRFKLLRAALTYEAILNEKIESGEFGAREAEMMYFFMLKGASLTRGPRFIQYQVTSPEMERISEAVDETNDDDDDDEEAENDPELEAIRDACDRND